MSKLITIQHGEGGVHTNNLIKDIFYKHLKNNMLMQNNDSTIFNTQEGMLAYTTDSFVVKPVFFKGGDIGKLAVCGTVNDLTAAGAIPRYLSAGFIIEEGFEIDRLEKIVKSMSLTCQEAGVKIITGDTKVVEKGGCDSIFINTSGIGVVMDGYIPKPLEVGDEIIITGGIAEHGTAIAIERYGFEVNNEFISDCAPMNHILHIIKEYIPYIKCMKDPTRAGLSGVLNEIADKDKVGMIVYEENIPIKDTVKGITDILGLDAYNLACEGRMVLIVKKDCGQVISEKIRSLNYCEDTKIIGNVFDKGKGYVYIQTNIGGKRRLNMLEESILPRIC